jgi:chromosome segregation ATPase
MKLIKKIICLLKLIRKKQSKKRELKATLSSLRSVVSWAEEVLPINEIVLNDKIVSMNWNSSQPSIYSYNWLLIKDDKWYESLVCSGESALGGLSAIAVSDEVKATAHKSLLATSNISKNKILIVEGACESQTIVDLIFDKPDDIVILFLRPDMELKYNEYRCSRVKLTQYLNNNIATQ